jgi:methionine biosynthesis protein MetW
MMNPRDNGMTDSSSSFQEHIYNAETLQKNIELKDLKVRQIMKQLLVGDNCRVLDVGCGDGALLSPFCRFHDCYGVDVSEVQLKKAKMKGLKTFRVDLENKGLPFENEFFDLIVCSETVEHLLDIDNLLSEIYRSLRLGGTFILTFPNINQPISWIMGIVYDLPPRFSARYKSPHVRDYTLRIIRNIMRNFGFTIIQETGTYVFPFENKFSQWLASSFPRLSEKIVVVSKKGKKANSIRSGKIVWDVSEIAGKKTDDCIDYQNINCRKRHMASFNI